MLMSKSRLEKFLYALYSLDYSDLPTPLSRIEELYNCLVTGAEVPTFEPLSRVEKYLMAILGVYKVNDLPLPLSRVEVLLHKLATGNDNLDDIESFLSRHEELLAEIIRNGGIDGDYEYLKYSFATGQYTLENTAEQPIKSAVLKGQTMINHAQITSHDFNESRTPIQNLNKPLETGKSYTIIMNIVSQTTTKGVATRFGKNNAEYTGIRTFNGVGLHKYAFTATNDFNQFAPYVDINEYQAGLRAEYNQLMILEGDYTNVDIPYFEGMQSVENPVVTTTGKNLFDINGDFPINAQGATYTVDGNSITVNGSWYVGQPLHLKPSTYYTGSFNTDGASNGYYHISVYADNQTTYLGAMSSSIGDDKRFKYFNFYTPKEFNDISVLLYASNGGNNTVTYSDIQIEEGSVATEYEPYKSTTVTCNEEVELHGIGEVKDELDLVTGEVTRRIKEIVYDGSEDEQWTVPNWWSVGNTQGFEIPFSDMDGYSASDTNTGIPMICQEFPVNTSFENFSYSGTGDYESVSSVIRWKVFGVRLAIDKLETQDADGLRKYLSENPLHVFYVPYEPTIEQIDISAVDQDGNNTKLKTFEDITYVTLSSEELIPEAELEVATKNEEVLNTLSLRMDDIYATQNALQETSNAQSENVDSTMLAATEIYEGLL